MYQSQSAQEVPVPQLSLKPIAAAKDSWACLHLNYMVDLTSSSFCGVVAHKMCIVVHSVQFTSGSG